MFGMRQPLDGPIFEKLEDAQNWCIHAMISHFDRRKLFKGMVDCGPPPDPARIRDIERICENVTERAAGQVKPSSTFSSPAISESRRNR
jgi:hypothetical protein